eukprot:8586899-Pyramimonas_sp.AAC.1
MGLLWSISPGDPGCDLDSREPGRSLGTRQTSEPLKLSLIVLDVLLEAADVKAAPSEWLVSTATLGT